MEDKQKDLAKDLAYEEMIKEKISLAILNGESTVIIGDDVLNIESSKESEIDENYDIVLEDACVGKAIKDKKNNTVNVLLNLKMINEKAHRDTRKKIQTQRDIKESNVNKNDTNALRLEIEQGLKDGNAIEMETDREFSTTENMRMFVNRAWGIDSTNIYMVKDRKDAHTFKYVAKTKSGDFKEINLSSRREGTNPNQKIWVMQNGQMKSKTVDSLLLKGEFAIATDIPDSAMSGTRTTYLVQRTPRGEYIAIAAGQKKGINRNTTSDMTEKDFMSRENSVYDLEDVIKCAQLAERIYGFNKDGKLTAKEVEIVKRLKIDKRMTDKEVTNIVDVMVELKEMGYRENEIKQIVSAKSKDEMKKLAENLDNKEKDSDEKLPGGGIRTRGGGNPHEE